MERSVNKLLDVIDNLDYSQEYQVIYTISIVKTKLNRSKCLYEEMKMINLNIDQDIFDSFEEEHRIPLMDSILSNLKIIQDRCKVNNRIQDRP